MHHLSLTQDCFRLILRVRDLAVDEDPEPTYTALLTNLESMVQQPQALQLREDDGAHVAYALSALADEVGLRAAAPVAHFWASRKLQVLLFNDNSAGDGFFERLALLRQDPGRAEVLRVYYLALALGFEGRYGVSGTGEELAEITTTLRRSIMAPGAAAVTLAAQALPEAASVTPTGPVGAQPGGRRRSAVLMCLGFLVLSGLMQGYLAAKSGALTQRLTGLTEAESSRD